VHPKASWAGLICHTHQYTASSMCVCVERFGRWRRSNSSANFSNFWHHSIVDGWIHRTVTILLTKHTRRT